MALILHSNHGFFDFVIVFFDGDGCPAYLLFDFLDSTEIASQTAFRAV